MIVHLMRSVSVVNGKRIFDTVCGERIVTPLKEIPLKAGVTGWHSKTTCESCR